MRRNLAARFLPGLVILFASLPFVLSQTSVASGRELATFSIEELMHVEIVTAAKKPVKIEDSTSAVFLITQEDIRRSGANTVPDVLRMVPGLNAARIEANQWALSIRGFNGRFGNKLLVLIDGRSVYTPSFAGVYWEVQDLLLEDIDRIEVIRGPGASLWGSNAVNGVINIITKHSRDTQGGLVTAGIGTEDRTVAGTRYGLKVGDTHYVRIFAKHHARDGFVDPDGVDTPDDGHLSHVGFRTDWAPGSNDTFTVQGDYYKGEFDHVTGVPSLVPPTRRPVNDQAVVEGANLLARWRRTFSGSSDLTFQVFYDGTRREEVALSENRDTADIDLTHRFGLSAAHEMVWGLGYRYTRDDVEGTFYISAEPERRGDHLFSAFVQDEVAIIPDHLSVTVGTKVEHNDYSGWEWQPNVRVLWKPDAGNRVWGAISRAVRTPTRIEQDGTVNSFATEVSDLLNAVGLVRVEGNDDLDAESLWAFELGYRTDLVPGVSLDFAGYYNLYDDLRTGEPGAPLLEADPPPLHVVLPFSPENKGEAQVYGVEVALDWQVRGWLKVRANYSYLKIDIDLKSGSQDAFLSNAEDESPRNQFSILSSFDLPRRWEFDAWLRFVDELPYLETDRYVTLDLRLGWKASTNLEFALVGQNLLEEQHREFEREGFFLHPVEVQRSVFGKLVWSF